MPGESTTIDGVDTALAAYLDRLRHGAAVDEWLADLKRDHGPVPVETLEWAARLVEDWVTTRSEGRGELVG